MTTPDPLAGLACPICGGPVSLQYSREHPLRPWQMRWQVVIGCCRTLQMEARTLEPATNAAEPSACHTQAERRLQNATLRLRMRWLLRDGHARDSVCARRSRRGVLPG